MVSFLFASTKTKIKPPWAQKVPTISAQRHQYLDQHSCFLLMAGKTPSGMYLLVKGQCTAYLIVLECPDVLQTPKNLFFLLQSQGVVFYRIIPRQLLQPDTLTGLYYAEHSFDPDLGNNVVQILHQTIFLVFQVILQEKLFNIPF